MTIFREGLGSGLGAEEHVKKPRRQIRTAAPSPNPPLHKHRFVIPVESWTQQFDDRQKITVTRLHCECGEEIGR